MRYLDVVGACYDGVGEKWGRAGEKELGVVWIGEFGSGGRKDEIVGHLGFGWNGRQSSRRNCYRYNHTVEDARVCETMSQARNIPKSPPSFNPVSI